MLETIGSLYRELEKYPDTMVVMTSEDSEYPYCGFDNPHSWRGVYAEAAMEPVRNGGFTVGEFKYLLDRLLSEEFIGWKGGEYYYNTGSHIYVTFEGSSGELSIDTLTERNGELIADLVENPYYQSKNFNLGLYKSIFL